MPDDRTPKEMLADYRLAPGSPEAAAKGCSCKPSGGEPSQDIECPLHGWRAFGKIIGQME
jgi:hypothetical protein